MVANSFLKCNRNFSYNGNGATITLPSISGNFSLGGQGNFNLNNANVNVYSTINISINGRGSISFINSNIDCNSWTMGSINLTPSQSANSRIKIRSSLSGGTGNTYYNVECYAATATHSIYNGIFNKISVLEGNGDINSITTDTLLLQSGRTYTINGMVIVNNFFEAKPKTCGGQLRLCGNNVTFNLGSSAGYVIENALIHDFAVSRPITAQQSYDWGNNANITFTAPNAGRDLYWTGGTGS